jgi:dihydrofolate reductase
MRKLIYAINMTLDGCVDHTKGAPNPEIYDYYGNLLREADTLLYGRKTYQLMVPYWPDVAKDQSGDSEGESDFALAFDAVDNIIVVSRTLEKAEGKKTRIVRANVEAEILRLKQEPGRNILTGGVDFPSQLVQLGLIDEFRIIIQPWIVGEGRRLWDGVNLAERLSLKLVESKVFTTGHVALRYFKH